MFKTAILGCLALLAAVPSQEKKPTHAVIVNTKNKCSQTGDAAKVTVKKLFLKQLTKWPDGTEARPYGRKKGSAEMKSFAKKIVGMSDAELARYWLKRKNMNGTTPPKAVSSDRMILKYIARHEGALGIVAIDAVKGAKGVKILSTF